MSRIRSLPSFPGRSILLIFILLLRVARQQKVRATNVKFIPAFGKSIQRGCLSAPASQRHFPCRICWHTQASADLPLWISSLGLESGCHVRSQESTQGTKFRASAPLLWHAVLPPELFLVSYAGRWSAGCWLTIIFIFVCSSCGNVERITPPLPKQNNRTHVLDMPEILADSAFSGIKACRASRKPVNVATH